MIDPASNVNAVPFDRRVSNSSVDKFERYGNDRRWNFCSSVRPCVSVDGDFGVLGCVVGTGADDASVFDSMIGAAS